MSSNSKVAVELKYKNSMSFLVRLGGRHIRIKKNEMPSFFNIHVRIHMN